MISISKAQHLPSFRNRGPGKLGNDLFTAALSTTRSCRLVPLSQGGGEGGLPYERSGDARYLA